MCSYNFDMSCSLKLLVNSRKQGSRSPSRNETFTFVQQSPHQLLTRSTVRTCRRTPNRRRTDITNRELRKHSVDCHRPRQYGHSKTLSQECSEPDEAGEVGRLFLIPCRHSPIGFDPAKEPLDHIPVLVAASMISLLRLPCRDGPDAGSRPQPPHTLANGVAVIRRIRNHMGHRSRFQFLQQTRGLRSVTALPGGHQQFQQTSASVDGRMQLGRQPSSAASQAASVVGGFFFHHSTSAGRGHRMSFDAGGIELDFLQIRLSQGAGEPFPDSRRPPAIKPLPDRIGFAIPSG